jgi:hypothetical protein
MQGYEAGARLMWQNSALGDNGPAGDALQRREASFLNTKALWFRPTGS